MNPYNIIASVLIVYMVLCMVRVFLSWFGNVFPGRIRLLAAVTDPWLGLFARIKVLKFRYLDLSPLVALIVLQLLIQIFWRLSIVNHVTVGWILFVLVTLIAAAINFFLLFFIILAVVRLIGLFVTASSVQRFWYTLDHILQPIVYPLISRLSPNRIVPYGTGLTIFAAILIALDLAVQLGLGALGLWLWGLG